MPNMPMICQFELIKKYKVPRPNFMQYISNNKVFFHDASKTCSIPGV